MPSKKKTEIAREFTVTRDFIRRYSVIPDDELDIVTVWAMGTWTFSPRCTNPATYPYLYVAAAKGSGKTVLGVDVLGCICRNHRPTVGITGPSVFRMIGEVDDETGAVINMAPTLVLDEIDATYSGSKDEDLRQMLNAGYKRGSTVPRSFGKQSISFPVYCPKLLLGIDNGHLPPTVTDRSIRIELKRATLEEMKTIEPIYSFDVEDESADIQSMLSEWAMENSQVLRDYRPASMLESGELNEPRQWEIARSLVQLAHALGIEDRIRGAIHRVMTRNPERPDHKVLLYRSIFNLFSKMAADRLTTRQILAQLAVDGVSVPGNSGKGLASVLSEDGVAATLLRLPEGHAGIVDGQPVQRGYMMFSFDGPFMRYLEDED